MPYTHLGQPPVAVLTKPMESGNQLVLRIWDTGTRISDVATQHRLLAVSFSLQGVDSLPFGFFLPDTAQLSPSAAQSEAAAVAKAVAAVAGTNAIWAGSTYLAPSR